MTLTLTIIVDDNTLTLFKISKMAGWWGEKWDIYVLKWSLTYAICYGHKIYADTVDRWMYLRDFEWAINSDGSLTSLSWSDFKAWNGRKGKCQRNSYIAGYLCAYDTTWNLLTTKTVSVLSLILLVLVLLLLLLLSSLLLLFRLMGFTGHRHSICHIAPKILYLSF